MTHSKPRRFIALVAGICIGVAAGWFGRPIIDHQFGRGDARPSRAETADLRPAQVDSSSAIEPATSIVELTPEKAASLAIETKPVAFRDIAPTNKVPARIRYDDRRHIAITAATDGVLTDVRVAPGDRVDVGTVLAVMTSPAIGTARADVLKRQAELDAANRELNWRTQVGESLKDLATAVKNRQSLDDIKRSFADRPLGDVRELVTTAYSRLLLAEDAANAFEQGRNEIVSARVAAQRIGERDTAAAGLSALVEQSVYESTKDQQTARASVEDAERRVKVAQEVVRSLLRQDDVSPEELVEFADLSRVNVISPLSGTIETRAKSTNERVEAGMELFVIADVSKLWVSADLRERDWQALSLQPGDPLVVSLAVGDDIERRASVYFVGREVDPQTNAVPLVAELTNADGLLRPGMFCRVAVPAAERQSGLVVPESALLTEGDETFVFVADGERTYRRVDVAVSLVDDGFAVIASGLAAGEKVVSENAFVLKSELLLEGEE